MTRSIFIVCLIFVASFAVGSGLASERESDLVSPPRQASEVSCDESLSVRSEVEAVGVDSSGLKLAIQLYAPAGVQPVPARLKYTLDVFRGRDERIFSTTAPAQDMDFATDGINTLVEVPGVSDALYTVQLHVAVLPLQEGGQPFAFSDSRLFQVRGGTVASVDLAESPNLLAYQER